MITGVSKLKTDDRLKVFPNPFTNDITIEYPAPEQFTIEILNSNGQKVFENNVNTRNTYKTDLSAIPAGIYFLQAKTEKKTLTSKIVKY